MATGHLVDVECTYSLGPNHGLHCNHVSYIARGDATGMSAHDASWPVMHGGSSHTCLHRRMRGACATLVTHVTLVTHMTLVTLRCRSAGR